MKTLVFILMGYLSGSVLYARVFAGIFGKEEMIENSKDKNPGTANAFMYGGFLCGVMTLVFDILKGFVPVYLFMRYVGVIHPDSIGMALVLATPVVGHAFPVFYKMKGGKGIAVTFGCLLGLLPSWKPVVILAAYFIFFSCILRVTPHFYRTLAAYLCSLCSMAHNIDQSAVLIGFAIITIVVCIRMFASGEEKERMRIRLLWMH